MLVAITPIIGGMCVTWISACCGHLCSSIISVDGFMVVDIGSLQVSVALTIIVPLWLKLSCSSAHVLTSFV